MTGTVSPSTADSPTPSPAELGLPFLSPQPLWQCSVAALAETRTTAELSGPWRLLLLGDGSPTRHLELLTGAPVEVELIAMAPDPAGDGRVPAEVGELSPPLLRRQVWLRCGGQALAWAESWWNQTEAEQSLRDRQLPIWRSLSADRAELFREVDGLARVQASWLQQGFAEEGPYWSRHYRFFRDGRELTVIREVFSPALERWLGPSSSNNIS
ncbi:chorismate lyase [Synechococcus sp. CS-603]|uniref:chorismate lyase n=1 Tax=Synechococcus sp. CS-603 TaxID=2847981 RepID=UPI00223B9D46|nr:chorismate lyase [Synechococcus sp. CS-603]MCT0201455.1 chorismate lyase [Synechococcus sp. CS-603]